MTDKNEHPVRKYSAPGVDRLYLVEAMRFLDDACNNWRALAVHWTEAGDRERMQDALARMQQCDLKRRRLLAAIEEAAT
jgi:hypothetical protein